MVEVAGATHAEGRTELDRHRVVIVIGWMRHYTASFMERLREQLNASGIDLDVVYGTAQGFDGDRGDEVEVSWAHHIPQREYRLGPLKWTWQPALGVADGAQLVVVQQATRHLFTYALFLKRLFRGPRVALWGHGRNFQARSRLQRMSERLKAFLTRRADWFFAYNELSAQVVEGMGFPAERVTVVGNSVDTQMLALARQRVTDDDRRVLADRLRIESDNVGIYCGAMYPEKRIGFLVESAEQIRAAVPDFELIFVGGGVDRHLVEAAARRHPWMHAVGPQFGDDLALHFALAKVLLIPGAVGLAVLDSFALETPLITTSDALHGPEISHISDGTDGVVVEGDGSGGSYAATVIEILRDDNLLEHLIEGCRRASQEFSVEKMAEQFAAGINAALGEGRR